MALTLKALNPIRFRWVDLKLYRARRWEREKEKRNFSFNLLLWTKQITKKYTPTSKEKCFDAWKKRRKRKGRRKTSQSWHFQWHSVFFLHILWMYFLCLLIMSDKRIKEFGFFYRELLCLWKFVMVDMCQGYFKCWKNFLG